MSNDELYRWIVDQVGRVARATFPAVSFCIGEGWECAYFCGRSHDTRDYPVSIYPDVERGAIIVALEFTPQTFCAVIADPDHEARLARYLNGFGGGQARPWPDSWIEFEEAEAGV